MNVDPTAIPLHLDLLHQRVTGQTYHGNHLIDVPVMAKVTANLWVGGCTAGLLLPREIEHVVSLYPWEQYQQTRDLTSMLSIRMYDSEDQAFGQVKGIAAWVNACREDGPTLVHCQAGLNRSNLVIAAALLLSGWDHDPAVVIDYLRCARDPDSVGPDLAVLCNASFEEWLLAWD